MVRGDDTSCSEVQMSPLSKPELDDALDARKARLQHVATLKPIEVRAQHWRNIRGTTDHCVDARFLRGWTWGKEGLVIEVAPRRHSGHRYYKVETVDDCRDLASADTIRLTARSGDAAVCGRPGDKLMMKDESTAELRRIAAAAGAAAAVPPQSHVSRLALERGCEISKLAPLP